MTLEVLVGPLPPLATSTAILPLPLTTMFHLTARQPLTSPLPTHALPPRPQVVITAAAPLPLGTDLLPTVRAVLHPPLRPSGTIMAVTKLMRAAVASLRRHHTEAHLAHHTAVPPNPAMAPSRLIPLNPPTAVILHSHPTVVTPRSLPMVGSLIAPTAAGALPLLLVPPVTAADTLVTRLAPLPSMVVTVVVHHPTLMVVQ